MAATTSYGTWGNHAGSVSIHDTVADFVNGGGQRWCGLRDEIRQAIEDVDLSAIVQRHDPDSAEGNG